MPATPRTTTTFGHLRTAKKAKQDEFYTQLADIEREVRRRAFPVHDAVLAQPQIWYGQYAALAPDGTTFEVVAPDAEVP